MDARIRAADTILDRGVRFKMPAPFFIRLLGLNKIRIKPFRPGTILEFSRIVLEAGLENASELSVLQLQAKVKPIARCLAVSQLNSRWKIKWLSGLWTRWILWHTHYLNLIEMFLTLQRINAAYDFTIITKFYSQQTAMMMNPKNLGQQRNGS